MDADFSELKKYIENWMSAYEGFEIFLKKFLLEQANRAIADIKNNTAVDTGWLKANWVIGDESRVIKTSKDGKYYSTVGGSAFAKNANIDSVKVIGDNFEVTISNKANYASFYEYGHRNWSTNTWIEGRFVMTIGIDRIQREMPSRFDHAFQEYLKSKGVI